MTSIVDQLVAEKIKPILIAPTMYDFRARHIRNKSSDGRNENLHLFRFSPSIY